MKLVPLTKGEFAMVDDEDYELVTQHKWSCRKKKHTSYAIATVRVNGKKTTVLMHRLILNGFSSDIDHQDTNGLNNQKTNLRPATNAQNGHNRKLQPHSSKYKGVSWKKRNARWIAQISVHWKKLHLGCFASEAEAAKAYDTAAIQFFPDFARTNKMMGLL